MTTVEVWDTGLSNGIVRATYTPDTFPVIDWVLQLEGGLYAVVDYLHSRKKHGTYPDELVAERFRPMPRVYRDNEWQSLRIEGALAMWAPGVITWQYNDQLLIGGMVSTQSDRRKRAAENKRAADNVLRGLGLWRTGKDVGMKDANDVNSAMKHLVAYLRNSGHKPTIEALHELM